MLKLLRSRVSVCVWRLKGRFDWEITADERLYTSGSGVTSEIEYPIFEMRSGRLNNSVI